jgi:hypothetical protein
MGHNGCKIASPGEVKPWDASDYTGDYINAKWRYRLV